MASEDSTTLGLVGGCYPHYPFTSMFLEEVCPLLTQDFVQTFLLSTIVNTFADQDPNRSWPEKVARAALISVPVTVAVDTTRALSKVANRFPNLGINDQTSRPASEQELAIQVSEKVQQAQLRIIASYTRPEDQWKNPTS